MTSETLKKLITSEFKRSILSSIETQHLSELETIILNLIDLYSTDNIPASHISIDNSLSDEVPYASICPCNPANGGSGICGCIMGNKLVPNPKKYTYPVSKFGTTTELQDPYSPTAKWITTQQIS